MNRAKRWYAELTPPGRRAGRPAVVIEGTDLLIGLSGARVVPPEALGRMAETRSSSPWPTRRRGLARGGGALRPDRRHGSVGLSEPDQQRPRLPGDLRGALDSRARAITEAMKLAAARAIASVVADDELREDYIIPSAFNREVAPAVAEAVEREARASAVAGARDELGFAAADRERAT
jgi:malate dehydrogenase (oxaloacetate-decarboxylating)